MNIRNNDLLDFCRDRAAKWKDVYDQIERLIGTENGAPSMLVDANEFINQPDKMKVNKKKGSASSSLNPMEENVHQVWLGTKGNIKETATRLGIPSATVSTNLYTLTRKLGYTGATEYRKNLGFELRRS